MGGAAVCLMAPDELQRIFLSFQFRRSKPVRTQFGHIVPGTNSDCLEAKYVLSSSRCLISEAGRSDLTFSAEWIIREKIRSQYQRHGAKQAVDLQDVENLPSYVGPGKAEPNFDHD
ncbi:hypothetical protein PENVUL_c090G07403 [Penicillium vulpinum]|uniref:Uncharacterized protein n=1 Tax=Penicillium vulpinum TaxID=29845 RepID=A0A1V6R4R7_9EURO|nr:hypothetical protein PENVUL_c090G07403 [Penicillium vulpinum]